MFMAYQCLLLSTGGAHVTIDIKVFPRGLFDKGLGRNVCVLPSC